MTESLLADFLTNLLQGSPFRRLRGIIMGITHFPVEERVGKYRKVDEIFQGENPTGGWTDANENAVNEIMNSDVCKDVVK